MLMQFYWRLRRSIDDFGGLTAGGKHAESMFTLVDRRFVSPLDRSVDICHAAIKAQQPEGGNETEQRSVLLYDHAINFDGSDEEKRAILAEAMLAIPISDSIKSEVIRFPKTKFGEGGELHEVKDGNRVIWRSYTPAKELKRQKERQAAAK